MKNLLISLFLFLLYFQVSAQKNCFIFIHTNYKSTFDTVKHYPVMVEYWLTSAHEQCAGKLVRNNTFGPDPLLPSQTNLNNDYVLLNKGLVGVKYARGHNMACEDNLCQGTDVEKECFYHSNMCAQWQSLNGGSWKALENLSRNLAKNVDSVHVWCGSVGEAVRIGRLSVPTQCWKVIFVNSTHQWHAYIFQNSKNDSVNKNPEVKVSDVENLTGFKFE